MKASHTLIRAATLEDAGPVTSIYAPVVRDTIISFEIEPPSITIMKGRMESVLQRYPWLVALRDGQVLGYAYASEHSERAAYRWSVNVSAYVAPSAHRQGIGRRLYETLISVLKAQGYRAAFAGITLPNAPSVGLHEAVGFTPVGVYKKVGFKLGAWHDVGWWQHFISDATEPPLEPVAFMQFRQTPDCEKLLNARSSAA